MATLFRRCMNICATAIDSSLAPIGTYRAKRRCTIYIRPSPTHRPSSTAFLGRQVAQPRQHRRVCCAKGAGAILVGGNDPL